MHDVKAICADPDAFNAAMARRGIYYPTLAYGAHEDDRPKTIAEEIVRFQKKRNEYLTLAQDAQAARNVVNKHIGIKKAAKEDTSLLEDQAKIHRDTFEKYQAFATVQEEKLYRILTTLPNVLDASTPDGSDERHNVRVSEAVPPDVKSIENPLQHFELGEASGQMLFKEAAKMAGSRFTILKGNLARLERALGQFMIDVHVTRHGFTELAVPALVNRKTMFGTGQLPKFANDLFYCPVTSEAGQCENDYRYLIPTAEVALTNMVADEIVAFEELPLRYVALTDCFRAEAGSAGKDVRGMLRQHQFKKVELVSIVDPDKSEEEHLYIVKCAETILDLLNIPRRTMLLCSGDTGFSAAKTFDLEVWLPGQNMWREISSCSNTRDFQARRMGARTRKGDKVVHVHTLNGSGVAVGRALIAVMENYQQADGSIIVPDVLVPYMGGLTVI